MLLPFLTLTIKPFFIYDKNLKIFQKNREIYSKSGYVTEIRKKKQLIFHDILDNEFAMHSVKPEKQYKKLIHAFSIKM